MTTPKQPTEPKVRAWLKTQRDDLINMSRTNRLLYFKHTKTASLEISAPSAPEVLERISRSTSSYWNFYLPPAEDDEQNRRSRKSHELSIADKDAKQIDKALRLLERKANQDFVDKGLWVLYLGLGMLHWAESQDDDRPGAAPLVLVPVTVARDSLRDSFRLRRTEDDPVINPALTVKLSADFDLDLPTVDDFEKDGLEGVLQTVAALVAGRKGWSVEQRAVLSTFTFQKEAMYRDLLDNEDELVANSMIELLALGPDAPSAGAFDFEALAEESLDRKVPPEDLVSVRDADSTQRTCIIAARDGHSFVMDGPPGSGKSQTITNIIAELMHAGKTVLFVSEKAAALEVVYNRLKDANLDDFALQLHSHNATRKAVAAELGRALASRPRANGAFTQARRADLIKRREALSSYAQALNEVRQPLSRSLHGVLGSISQLQTVPQAPVPEAFGRNLGQEQLTSLLDTAAELGRAWGPVERGDEFLWRELRDASQSASRQRDVERDLDHAQSKLNELQERVEAIDSELGLGWYDGPQDARKLLDLLVLLDERRSVPPSWLTLDSIESINDRSSELSTLCGTYHAESRALNELVGERFTELQPSVASDIDAARARLRESQISWHPEAGCNYASLCGQSEFLAGGPSRLAAIASDAERVAVAFNLQTRGLTVNRAAELAELGALVDSAVRPEAAWLNPATQAALTEAVRVLRELADDFRSRRERIRETFTDGVLDLDLVGLQARFAEVHRGLGKLRRAYRDDKKTLASCTVSGKVDTRTLERLADAVAWKEVAQRLSSAERQHAGVLGGNYYQNVDADFDRIEAAITTARDALRLAGEEGMGTSLAQQLAVGQSPDPALPVVSERLRANIASWREDARAAVHDISKQLSAQPLDRLRDWTGTAASDVSALAEAVGHVDRIAGRPVSLEFAAKVLDRAVRLESVRASVDSQRAADTDLLGSAYVGVGTDWVALGSALAWARALRAKLGRPAHTRIAEALLETDYTSTDLRDVVNEWSKAQARITDQFGSRYADTVAVQLDENFADAATFLQSMAATISDMGEWAAHIAAKKRLDEQGLEPVIAFCIDQRVAADQVRSVVERALLEAWADDVTKVEKSRLGAERALDRDALAKEFRELDELQVRHAAARVINTCTQKRPNSTVGEAGIIQREGEKQRRHMPIRSLLSRAGGVAQRLKPCFMMSPLSVSQYLPPSLRFDAVIFDEASQVRPCDAVNCVYRADQLIVAGDQKQLPPTSFFGTIGAADDDTYDEDQIDDFESVLDLCKGAGGLRSLPLQWHYRSQHESLITYSNYRIYNGSLLTFPGAKHEAQDVGLELFKVDGIYRRGSARDNPVEATKVIERVLYHRRQHPELTVGVVTFSSAQEQAITNELERQARVHQELAGLTADDRLKGFFVKNLENVQGDERDVIIFSVGYGPDEHGKFTLNMGPLNKAGGPRRLNVAITRAKRRVEIVTSVLAEQFPSDSASDGIRHVKGYLDFAARGMVALAHEFEDSKGEAESPFEEEVLRVIRACGYDAVPQVGVAGYRIDIGVRDPARPGNYVLAVECDGAMYHSSKVARDRDRLRQQVLEGLGWTIHRIWGTAWYRDRAGQETRLRNAIEAALRGEDGQTTEEPPAVEHLSVEEQTVDFEDEVLTWTEPYRLAETDPVYTHLEMHLPEARGQLRRLIEQVVRQEGPVHEDRVLQTVRRAWGVGRAGNRIRDAFDWAVHDLTRAGLQRDGDGFLSTKFSQLRVVRVPTDDSDTQREARHIPRAELQLAVSGIVREANTVAHDEVSIHVARLFGWRRRGPDVRAALEEAIDALIRDGALVDDGEYLRTAT